MRALLARSSSSVSFSLDMRITLLLILVVAVCTGCKRPADSLMEAFAETVRQTVEPGALKAWALTVISNTPRKGLFTEVPTNGVPKGVQSLMTNFATLELMNGSSNDVAIVYTRGSGFGHWGFAVGGPTYRCGLGHTQVPWTNGIWFWTE